MDDEPKRRVGGNFAGPTDDVFLSVRIEIPLAEGCRIDGVEEVVQLRMCHLQRTCPGCGAICWPSVILHPDQEVFDRMYAHDQESRTVTISRPAPRRDAILERGSHSRGRGGAARLGFSGARCTGVA